MAGKPRHVEKGKGNDTRFQEYTQNAFSNSYQNNINNYNSRSYLNSQFLKLRGGVMYGPTGSISRTLTLDAAGKLNIGSKDGTGSDPIWFKRRYKVDPFGASTDDTLEVIDSDGKELYGQEMILQGDASGNKITITHNSGSASGNNRAILCPHGRDYVLDDTETVLLVYDEANTVWILVGAHNNSIAEGDTEIFVDDTTSSEQIQFLINGVTLAAFNVDGSGDERLLFSGAYLDLNGVTFAGVDIVTPDSDTLRFTDETVLHAFTGFMGLSVSSVKPDITPSANVGALKIPLKNSTTGAPSTATLDSWFGDIDGCIGFQYNSSGGVTTLWGRTNGGWVSTTLS